MNKSLVDRLRESALDYADCATHCDLEIEAAEYIERLEKAVRIGADALESIKESTGNILRAMSPAELPK